jgi:hypothetical protein
MIQCTRIKAAVSPDEKTGNEPVTSPAADALTTPQPTATPLPPLTSPWPVGKFVETEDRRDAKQLIGKLYNLVFQSKPDSDLLQKFIDVAVTKPKPFNDRSIRELVILMMTTPYYQIT